MDEFGNNLDYKDISIPEAAVLMATFNGAKFIDKQLESIFNQKNVNVVLYIFDDGSSDNTLEKIGAYIKAGHNIRLLPSSDENLGAAKSFFHLMCLEINQDYIAFSDQDDIWVENHLSKSIEILGSKENSIVCSPRDFIDERGKYIGSSRIPRRPLSAQNAVVENIVFGNTIVMSKKTMQSISENLPEFPVMHDSWIYLWTSCFGEVIYLPDVTVKYRLHSHNSVGIKRAFNPALILRSMKRYMQQNLEFIELFKECDNTVEVRKFVESFHERGILVKCGRLFQPTFYRQDKIDNLILRILFLFVRI